MTESRLLNERDAARRLGLKPHTLAAWRCRGVGPRFVKVGRLIRYSAEDLSVYLKSRTRQRTTGRRRR